MTLLSCIERGSRGPHQVSEISAKSLLSQEKESRESSRLH